MEIPLPAESLSEWEELFQAALQEGDPDRFPERLQKANEAIVDSLNTLRAFSERHTLLAALRILRKMEIAAQTCQTTGSTQWPGESRNA